MLSTLETNNDTVAVINKQYRGALFSNCETEAATFYAHNMLQIAGGKKNG